MHGLKWDYSFPRSPHGEIRYNTRIIYQRALDYFVRNGLVYKGE